MLISCSVESIVILKALQSLIYHIIHRIFITLSLLIVLYKRTSLLHNFLSILQLVTYVHSVTSPITPTCSTLWCGTEYYQTCTSLFLGTTENSCCNCCSMERPPVRTSSAIHVISAAISVIGTFSRWKSDCTVISKVSLGSMAGCASPLTVGSGIPSLLATPGGMRTRSSMHSSRGAVVRRNTSRLKMSFGKYLRGQHMEYEVTCDGCMQSGYLQLCIKVKIKC